MNSFFLILSRSLWRRQHTHSSFAAITDCLCCSDKSLNLLQADGLCRCMHCGARRQASIRPAVFSTLWGPRSPLGDRPLFMSGSDIPSPSLYADRALVPSLLASTFPSDQHTGPSMVATPAAVDHRIGRDSYEVSADGGLDDAFV
jgi:hypothetical protein